MPQNGVKFMRAAIRLARQHMRHNEGGPFGAAIVRNDTIIGSGWNRVTSANDPTAHAEISAIRDACLKFKTFHLEGCTIYINCEPCPMCLAAIYWARLDKIAYAATRKDAAHIQFDDDLIYREISLPASRRKIPTKQLLRPEALKVFVEWDSKPKKISY